MNLQKVVAPPYDVISTEARRRYCSNSEYNIVWADFREDKPGEDKYAAAAALLDEWTRQQILSRDAKSAIYLVEQEFVSRSGEVKRRKGFIALLRLENLRCGTVFPHEKTFPRQKQDRLNLLRTTHTHFNPVLALYSEPNGEAQYVLSAVAANFKPAAEIAADEDGVIHRLWRIQDADYIGRLRSIVKDRAVFIADGHHRYETALAYAEELRSSRTDFHGDESFNYIMMCFVRMEEPGLEVLSAHRMLSNIPEFSESRILQSLEGNFRVTPSSREEMLANLNGSLRADHSFGIQIGNNYYFVSLRDEVNLEQVMPKTSKKWRNLDVSIMQVLVIEQLMGGEEEQTGNISYEVDTDLITQKTSAGECQVALFLAPTKISQLIDITTARETMPPKSTYFYPKSLTGLVMNRFSIDKRVVYPE